MFTFSKISSIQIDFEGSFENQLYLTFDIDWAHDEVLSDTVDLVEKAGACATWFVTHKTPILDRLKANKKFELGIHPNFNFLLKGECEASVSAEEVVKNSLKIVPSAKAVRSHSMTQSSILLDIFDKFHLKYDVNHFVPHHLGIKLKPWKLWNGLTRVPYCWEDDIHILYENLDYSEFQSPVDIALDASSQGLKVFDFHPIHVFLNTESLERYEATRSIHQYPEELIKHRYNGYGTRNRLIELLELCRHS